VRYVFATQFMEMHVGEGVGMGTKLMVLHATIRFRWHRCGRPADKKYGLAWGAAASLDSKRERGNSWLVESTRRGTF
jgi:hypothetical protein